MTVEEIEIIVTAEVTKALSELKKLQPEISSIMSGIQNKVNSLNMQKISSEAKKASKAVQETFDPDDTSFKITIDGKDFDEYEKNLKKISAEVTDTVDTINPALIILNAVSPALIVSGLLVNRPMRVPGITRHRTVPIAIIASISTIDVLYIFLTLSCSPAP